MQPALVLGSARATIKHESFDGERLLVLQPLGVDGVADGPPLLGLDRFGARQGDHVILTSDGAYARDMLGHDNTPARWTVMGLIDSDSSSK